ncbi:MAG: hypothetical protein ILA06_02625 [Bacteroidaceae bacterium]|nr:hypothetical protein [Bacteroidaceae bacterium]
MSLIKCPECGQQVSSKAPTCPHCGVRIEANIKRCPVCDSFVLMDAEQCPNCHTKFVVNEGRHDEVEETVAEQHHTPAHDTTVTEPAHEHYGNNYEHDDFHNTPSKKDAPWYLLLLAIIIIGVAGYFYWDSYQDKIASEEKAYAMLQDCNDPLNFEDFIARFPNSKYVPDVRERLKDLQQEDALWTEACKSLNITALQNYVDTHPTSPHKKEALFKIDSIEWRQAEQQGTSAAFEAYIERHENGTYITEAYNARDNAKAREERARRDSIAALQRDTIQAEAAATATTEGASHETPVQQPVIPAE